MVNSTLSSLTVKIAESGLSFSLFSYSYFHFFLIYFHFSIFRTLGLGLEEIGHAVTSVTSDGVVTM